MEYMIVQASNEVNGSLLLTRMVNEHMQVGWECTGGVCFAPGVYCQAMVREKKPVKKAVK